MFKTKTNQHKVIFETCTQWSILFLLVFTFFGNSAMARRDCTTDTCDAEVTVTGDKYEPNHDFGPPPNFGDYFDLGTPGEYDINGDNGGGNSENCENSSDSGGSDDDKPKTADEIQGSLLKADLSTFDELKRSLKSIMRNFNQALNSSQSQGGSNQNPPLDVPPLPPLSAEDEENLSRMQNYVLDDKGMIDNSVRLSYIERAMVQDDFLRRVSTLVMGRMSQAEIAEIHYRLKEEAKIYNFYLPENFLNLSSFLKAELVTAALIAPWKDLADIYLDNNFGDKQKKIQARSDIKDKVLGSKIVENAACFLTDNNGRIVSVITCAKEFPKYAYEFSAENGNAILEIMIRNMTETELLAIGKTTL